MCPGNWYKFSKFPMSSAINKNDDGDDEGDVKNKEEDKDDAVFDDDVCYFKAKMSVPLQILLMSTSMTESRLP